ncbi:MAG: serine protease [Desulfobulbaceae bacterium]|nr:serine protease [Desulfobulbaceae bacterium]HIJ79328.1 nodulation protein NfeD [Deltaproteobacteria bacterium]
MAKIKYPGLFLLLLVCIFFSNVKVNGQGVKNVYVIPVAGDVEPAMAAFIERALNDSRQYQDALIVLEMSTFGGRVDAALSIVETMLAAAPRQTIAFVKDKAISAGALIALSCNRLVMRPNATIGDCAPITFAEDGPKMLGEKFQSPLRAKFRTLARRNGYPAKLAEAMVTAEMEIVRVRRGSETLYMEAREYEALPDKQKQELFDKKTVVAKDELLTMDHAEALAFGFSAHTADSIEEMLSALGIENFVITRVEQSWSESMGRFIEGMSPILLMIGLAALYLELKAPGFGVPGILGIICLGLVFFNQYLLGLADYTEFLIILIGLVFLAMEVFVLPGFGIAGLVGILALCVGLVLSFQDFVIPDPNLPWQQGILLNNLLQVFGACFLAFCLALLFLRFVFPKIGRMVEGPYLAATLAESHADSLVSRGVAVGEEGIAYTLLRPSGKVMIAGKLIDAITDGEFIDKESPVKVAKVKGNVVVVSRRDA